MYASTATELDASQLDGSAGRVGCGQPGSVADFAWLGYEEVSLLAVGGGSATGGRGRLSGDDTVSGPPIGITKPEEGFLTMSQVVVAWKKRGANQDSNGS